MDRLSVEEIEKERQTDLARAVHLYQRWIRVRLQLLFIYVIVETTIHFIAVLVSIASLC